MQERYLGRIQPGMDVCDSTGNRVGAVARVYRYDAGEMGATPAVASAAVATARDEIVEVKTGPFGLGRHFFVPLGQIHEVIEDSVILSLAGNDDMSRFRSKPAHFDRLH